MISIILPVYNGSRTLTEAIRSILEQAEQNFELIVVDDGSTDSTWQILENFAKKDERIRLLKSSHLGIVSALNKGLEAANGDLIARMDADDISHPKRLEIQRQYLEKNPSVGLVSCQVEIDEKTEKNRGICEYIEWCNHLIHHLRIYENRFVESPIIHPTVMFRKTLLELGEYRDGNFPEDYELWLRWLDGGVKMEKIAQKLFVWKDSSLRLTRVSSRYSYEAFYRCKAKYLARWLQRIGQEKIVVWGAGRISRRRVEFLISQGIKILAYVDVDPKKVGQTYEDIPVWHYSKLQEEKHFVVSYVANRGIREKIETQLISWKYRLGKDFILAA